MARRRHGFSRNGRSARLTQWIGPAAQDYVNVASGGATIIANLPFEEPVTVMRNRGMVSVRLQAYTADLTIAGAFGIGIVSAEAFAAGVASIPEPFNDGDWGGWFVWRSFFQRFEFDSAVDSTFPAAMTLEVDSKGMRKVGSNEVLVQVAESQTGAFALASGLRTLIKNA